MVALFLLEAQFFYFRLAHHHVKIRLVGVAAGELDVRQQH
jgi:hypothetical protein